VLLRTFSKVHGLCGLRVGFGLCGSEDFRQAVDQVRQPFFCNAAAQAAAIEALRHQDEVARRVEATVAERLEMDERLRELGYAPAASQANFCWFSVGDAEDEQKVMRGLAEQGIVVRAGTPLGREGALRVTYGLPQENRRFVEALASLR
jgi:histidinol-phosphate aminotransferase